MQDHSRLAIKIEDEMNNILESQLIEQMLATGSVAFGVNAIRYAIFAGGAYLVFWKLLKEKIQHRRIHPEMGPNVEHMKFEIKQSLKTISVFSLGAMIITYFTYHGKTLVYFNIADRGMGYLFLSFLMMIVVHDTYFYFTHRAMHHPKLFRFFHQTHHLSVSPDPWTSYSFAIPEALVQQGIMWIIAFFIPAHPIAVMMFATYSFFMNVWGHLAYELYPKNFIKKFGKILTSTTHHHLHHKNFRGNYGLYFIFWDRILGTNQEHYESEFRAVTHQPLMETPSKVLNPSRP